MPPSDVPATLLARLDALPPRDAALLERAVLEHVPAPELAHRLGIPTDALARGLWRAASGFAGRSAQEEPSGQELSALLAALTGEAPFPPAMAELEPLRTHAPQLHALFDAREARHARVEPWIRTVLAVLLILLAYWMSR